MNNSPGQAAFDKFMDVTHPDLRIEWEQLLPEYKKQWEAIAEAAIEVYEDPKEVGPIARDMTDEELAEFKRRWEAADPEDYAKYKNAIDYPE